MASLALSSSLAMDVGMLALMLSAVFPLLAALLLSRRSCRVVSLLCTVLCICRFGDSSGVLDNGLSFRHSHNHGSSIFGKPSEDYLCVRAVLVFLMILALAVPLGDLVPLCVGSIEPMSGLRVVEASLRMMMVVVSVTRVVLSRAKAGVGSSLAFALALAAPAVTSVTRSRTLVGGVIRLRV
jgi:hypothetical protein